MFLDHKKYLLDNLVYIQIMVETLAVCETTEVLVIKYQAENPKSQMSFSIWFLSNDDSLLYLAMKNIYSTLIVRFALHFIPLPNRKLYTTAFYELFYLVLTFLLFPSNNFQLSLSSFLEMLPNLYKAIAILQLVVKSSMVPHALDPSYYTPVETAATNEAINTAMPKFVAKVMDNENEHLRRHAVYLINNLGLL